MKRAITIGSLFLLGWLLWIPSGYASNPPWSGWWWPLTKGELIYGYRGEPGPLQKYDQYAYGYAPGPATNESLTYGYNYSPGAGSWFGLCNGWSAAAIMTQEPTSATSAGGITFHVGDQKGLLTEAWYNTSGDGWFEGSRYNGNPGDDLQDLYPDHLWTLLDTYVGQGVPIVLDLSANEEVWNYPVYDYDIQCSDLGGGWYGCNLSIWAATDSVVPDYVGTETISTTYTFNVYTEGGYIVDGYGYWTGNSVNDHPDFAWYPGSQPSLRNSSLNYSTIQQICSGSSGGNPVPQIWANGYGGSISVYEGTTVSVQIGLDAAGWEGYNSDWWILLYHEESGAWYSWINGYGWLEGLGAALQYPLFSIGSFEVFLGTLSAGTYDFYFGVDNYADGNLSSSLVYDAVQVIVTGGGGGGVPGKPTLISPYGYINTTSPTFYWYAVSGATYYYFYLYDGLSDTVLGEGWVSASSVTSGSTCYLNVGDIGYSTDFQWCVLAYNDAGEGPWSDGMGFYNATY